MKKTYIILCLLFLAGISFQSIAQTNPGTANLKHQWTFDDGTAKDVVGTVNGVLEGAATISTKALSTTGGGFMSFSGAEIAINSYPAITTEIWFTPSGSNTTNCNILSYFGNTTGTLGTDYIFTSPSSCNRVRAAISTLEASAPYNTENFVGYTGYIDDAKLHHLVTTYTATTITLYIDGVSQGSQDYTGSNTLSAIGTQFAYLAKGGYANDPTWKGLVHKYSLYDKALSADEVAYLYQKGAEEQPVITASVPSMVFDNSQPAVMFNVSGINLTAPISISAPAGIIVDPTSVAINAKDFPVTAIWDGKTAVDGKITLTSGTTMVEILVKSADDSGCFTPLYPNDINFINDPGMNSLASYQGWGAKELITVISNPENVYCGASTISIGNGTGTCSGSLDILNGAGSILQPNTIYRVKFMMKTVGGTFQFGADADPNQEFKFDTNGEWKAFDHVFTTGATIGNNIYINNCGGCTGTIAYVDNYELYVFNEPIISTSESAIGFDPETSLTSSFTVTSSNLTDDIILTAPAGITLGSNILPAASVGNLVEVIWDGTTVVNDSITLTSGTTVVKVFVKAITTSNTTCFTPLYTDRPNIVVDPYMNDFANFGGWGNRSINSDPANVYCGSRSGLISGGSIDVVLTGLIKENTSYKMKAMIKATSTNVNFGIWGWGGASDTISHPTVINEWVPIELEFTTLTLGSTHGAFFNNAPGSYIDNWELYEMTGTAIPMVDNKSVKIFVQNGKIVADFEVAQSSEVEFTVYNVQGAVISNEMFATNQGKTFRVLNANIGSGVYVVKMTVNGKSSFSKVIK